MRKTDKKTENQLRVILTDVCNHALETYPGFQWLTHQVNYASFPDSLRIVCVFDTRENLSHFLAEQGKPALDTLIHQKLNAAGIRLKKPASQIHYDTEESCALENNGQWAERLR
ncbi:Fis family transcriptional regulator [Photobacterium sp. R1]